MYKAKVRFLWFKWKESIPDSKVDPSWIKKGLVEKVCESVSEKPVKNEETSLDLNKDGKVNKADAVIGSKVMNVIKKAGRPSRKRA